MFLLILLVLDQKIKKKIIYNKSNLKEFSREHEHLQTDTKELTSENTYFESPSDFKRIIHFNLLLFFLKKYF